MQSCDSRMFVNEKIDRKKEACTTIAQIAITTFSLPTPGLSFIERNLKVWILSKKSYCIRRKTTKTFICGLWYETKDTVL